MNEIKNAKCPRCGSELPSGQPAEICPRCAADFLQASQTELPGAEGVNRGFIPPTVAELGPLFPQLEILELLGRGGMGAVYKARQKELDRIVALKILPPGIGKDESFAQRFAREAKALARLNHPGIVTIYDFGRADGLYYFLMEFVDGVNLNRLLDSDRILPREALAIVPQICDALQYAHDQGIVHRDIKPANILLDRRGRVKVADFGLAKLVGAEREAKFPTTPSRSTAALTEAGKVMGTPAYMAPEQEARPTEVDHRADIYALGVVFYQLLTGELPAKPLEPPSRKVQIDVRLDEVVLKAMEEVPARRYEQASQLKTAVETIVSHQTPEAGAQARTASKATQPRWWQIFLAGFLTVVLLEFGALALTEHGIGPFVLALLAGGFAVAIFIVARQVWLDALFIGMAVAFCSWLAVVLASTLNYPLALAVGLIGLAAYVFAMKKLGVSRGFFTAFMTVFLLVFGASVVVTFIMPNLFVGLSRIRIEAGSTAAPMSNGQTPFGMSSPLLVQTECEVIGSKAILEKVVQNLNLEPDWSRRYNHGEPLGTDKTVELLKHRLDLRPVRNTSVIEIRAFDETPEAAAGLANSIARVYQEFRAAQTSAGDAGTVLAGIQIIDLAVPALRPIRPNKPFNLALGALAGLLLGTAAGAGFAGYKLRTSATQ